MIYSGYLFEVISYEGDADYYATKRLDGLTESDVRFCVELMDNIKDRQEHERHGELNWVSLAEDVKVIADKYILEHPQLLHYFVFERPEVLVEEGFTFADYISEGVPELFLGYANPDDGSTERTFDRFTVHLVPEDCQELTRAFR